MFDAEPICPYTGLRSFTEEESLYFKGREEDIDQATAQLQRNKFLMLTGASGDGKSSLIYAGIIPNARAGFLKSKYTQWCVADFRPERSPFQNLCKVISRQLGIENTAIVESELNHGFSAIVDLYRNSKRHIDMNSVAWQRADDAGKAALKREAANLLILVDQFEEFFTNPENYHRGVPSTDATLVLNLLLETARIALEEDLPIYIVFTMRSDFIGQCAAFRGLPEYIGFSQFFVPRLNRTQLQQVIEEPAVLSGNQISRRLTERLIHDLTEGVDQLPILQHALNQVWHAASEGREELDLLHYAMVGGMPVQELPDEQVERFNNWFAELPETIRACYHEPNLQNVLDTHTNKLYEQAAEYYKNKTGKSIADEDAKAIIKAAFTCLTKIDQGRAVRNRMTLEEIREITGRKEFRTEEVGAVLDIFREPGNTFIRPFMTDDPASRVLQAGDVLDITHESLIRNWAYLEQWAKEEFDNYTVSLDFEQQLNRWVESGKSRDFLLPIGPLTYFESWFRKSRPNAYWIARYLPEEIEASTKLENAQQVLQDAREFVKRSAKKHAITRTVMRYGARRMATAVAVVAALVLAGIGIRNYIYRQNSQVLKRVQSQSVLLANKPGLRAELTAPLITEQLILGTTTLPEFLKGVRIPEQKIKVANAVATQLIMQGRNEPKKEILQSLTLADSLLEQLPAKGSNPALIEGLKLIHDHSVNAGYASFFNPDPKLRALAERNGRRAARWVMQILQAAPEGFDEMRYLSLALENGINYKGFSPEERNQVLQQLSPFENNARTKWVENNFQQAKIQGRGTYFYGAKFNGLFQELAYLYAANGNTDRALQCIDTLLKYTENYHQNDYANIIDNASNIAAVFYHYGHTTEIDKFVSGYCQRKKTSPVEFYHRLLTRTLVGDNGLSPFNYFMDQGFSNLNVRFSSDDMLAFFYERGLAEARRLPSPDERNFQLALFFKNRGQAYAYRLGIRGVTNTLSVPFFNEAVNYYQQVTKPYLGESQQVAAGGQSANMISQPRKFLFLYPDYRVPFHTFEPRHTSQYYQSGAFVQFVMDRQLFDSLYTDPQSFRYFDEWLSDYQLMMAFRQYYMHDTMPGQTLESLAQKLEARNAGQTADMSLLYLLNADNAFKDNKTEKAISCLEKMQPEKLITVLRSFSWTTIGLIANTIANLSGTGRYDLAYKILNVFKKEVNRSSLYGYASQYLSMQKRSPEMAARLLDSARAELRRDDPEVFQPNRHQLAIALMFRNPGKNVKEAHRTIKNSFIKFYAMSQFSRAFAYEGKLYRAVRQAPEGIAPDDQATFLNMTLRGYNMTQPVKPEWSKFLFNMDEFFNSFLVYQDENE